jgi:hypothetical protein
MCFATNQSRGAVAGSMVILCATLDMQALSERVGSVILRGESDTLVDNRVCLGKNGNSCRRGVDWCCGVAGINMGGGAGGIFEGGNL